MREADPPSSALEAPVVGEPQASGPADSAEKV